MMRGVKELRVKESDRIEAMATGLRANGVAVEDGPDWWIVHGPGRGRGAGWRDGLRRTHLDHRIAMSFLCARYGLGISPITVDDAGPIATSFPVFEPLMCPRSTPSCAECGKAWWLP
jgi:3-phosphoshikimate 1-carboxyvinyltransferase